METPLLRTAFASMLALAFAGCSMAPRDGGQADSGTLRVVLSAGKTALDELSPLRYSGGFETKTLVYETLVRRDGEGWIVPDLATAFRFDNGGRTWVFELPIHRRFHDGTTVTADAVRQHLVRWIGNPEHDWLGASSLVREVVADDARTLRIELSEPYALLPDLCAINPCAIGAPAMLDAGGDFVRPIGTGAFVWGEPDDDGSRMRYRTAARPRRDVVAARYADDTGVDPLALFLAGEVDVLFDSWLYEIPRERLVELDRDGMSRSDHPGSSVSYLDFAFVGATADVAVRRAVAAAIDRTELVDAVEAGLADECRSWAAPSVRSWPHADAAHERSASPMSSPPNLVDALRVLIRAGSARERGIGEAVVEQLRDAEIPATVVECDADAYASARETSAFDICIERTWGVPYDPHLSLVERFGARDDDASGAMAGLVQQARSEPDERARVDIYERIQDRIDRGALVVPLYAPRRLSIAREGIATPGLDHDVYRVDLMRSLR